MKLIVQIPCYNEAATLPQVVAGIPRSIEGVDTVEILVIDDGSEDGTGEIAGRVGVDHVLRNKKNLGLARSFQRGLDECLARGADIIVNTDGDDQYPGAFIPELIGPILRGEADIVVGDRRPHLNEHFSRTKRLLQRIGSGVVRALSEVDVADAVSGFRAYSRDAALGTNVMTTFSYTTETLIHAGQRGFAVASVQVDTNAPTRASRLFSSMTDFVRRQIATVIRAYTMYRPLRVFWWLGLALLLVGVVPIVRFLFFFVQGEGDGHIQSLVLGAMFFVVGYLTLMMGLLGDTIATNRQLLEATLERSKRTEIEAARENDESG